MDRPQLYGTPLSHFTRKIRVLLAELGVAFDFVRATGVLSTDTPMYGGNPLMRVPTLVHRGETLFESDHIARCLVAEYDPGDRLSARSDRAAILNQLAVANGIMSHAVVLILAERGGLTDVDGVVYFRKLMAAIRAGLAWLEAHVGPDEEDFGYADIATICMWQHLMHYALVQAPEQYPRLTRRIATFAGRPSIASTTPEVSLAEALAAGWSPTKRDGESP